LFKDIFFNYINRTNKKELPAAHSDTKETQVYLKDFFVI